MATDNLALVTGTSSGIGAATAALLLERGWTVVGCSRRDPPLAHARYEHLYLDLADHESLIRTVEKTAGAMLSEHSWSRVGLVNNAALTGPLGPLQNAEPDALLGHYAVNLVAPVWLMGFVSRRAPMHAQVRIVNVSSGAATHPSPGLGAYGSAKAALRMAGMVLAEEWSSSAVRAPVRADAAILSYEPGVVDTPMQTDARTQSSRDFPWVGMFQHFHDAGMLVPPALPARDLVDFLESDAQPVFVERRFAGR